MDTPDRKAEKSQRPFYWWSIADLLESGFVAALADASPDDRLEFHPDTKLFHIRSTADVSAQSHDGSGFNFSHVCPPDC